MSSPLPPVRPTTRASQDEARQHILARNLVGCLIRSGGYAQTVEQMLFSLPRGVREISRGQTDFSLNAAASREYNLHLARHPESHGPPDFDWTRTGALVQGTYMRSSHPTSQYAAYPSGVLLLGGGAQLDIGVVEEGPTPTYGQEVWAVVTIQTYEREVYATFDDWDTWTGSICIPEYSAQLAPDLARSRINRLWSEVSALSEVIGGLSEDDVRFLLAAVHSPSSVEVFDRFLPLFVELRQMLQPELRSLGQRLGPGALPPPRLIKTAVQAEEYAAEAMRALGYEDAAVTSSGADGGVDVRADRAVAQVKMEGLVTGRPVVQALYGVAALERVDALIFSLAGYTREAVQWANQANVGCFEFAFDGSIEARSMAAEVLLHADAGA